jgi:hypothetical protein
MQQMHYDLFVAHVDTSGHPCPAAGRHNSLTLTHQEHCCWCACLSSGHQPLSGHLQMVPLAATYIQLIINGPDPSSGERDFAVRVPA